MGVALRMNDNYMRAQNTHFWMSHPFTFVEKYGGLGYFFSDST